MSTSIPRSRRVRFELALSVASLALAVLALAWPDWLEAFGIDPDHGNGAVEWAIPVVLALVAAASGFLAHRHWRIDRLPGVARS